jgi:hypothetical protein
VAYEGWLSFAGAELINNQRTAAYANRAGMSVRHRARYLAASLGDAPYLDPASDDAPWYDGNVPESGRFFGVYGTSLAGADKSTLAAAWTELLTDGGVPGAYRRASVEVQVKATLLAADTAALSYGMGWLAAALRGSSCTPVCTGDQVCVYAAAPAAPQLVTAGSLCGSGIVDSTWDPVLGNLVAPGGNQLVRTLYSVATISGLEPVSSGQQMQMQGGVACDVQFTFRGGVPYWYTDPVQVASHGSGVIDTSVWNDLIANYDPWAWQANCPTETACLDDDPYCTVAVPAPVVAPVVVDPCFPNNPANDHGSSPGVPPQSHIFNAARVIFSIPRNIGPSWLEKVPIIQVFSGSSATQRLILRWYNNPRGVPCSSSLDPCFACAEINVPWIPKSTLLTIDGRTKRANLDCPGTTLPTEPRMYGPAGGLFEWPVFECSTPMCLEMIVSQAGLAPDAWITVSTATRQDAI